MSVAVNFYRVWNSVLLHCVKAPGKYDAVKYQFKVRIPNRFTEKHPDRFVYESFGKKLKTTEDMVFFSLANAHAGVNYIRDADLAHYEEFMRVHEGLSYWVEQDAKKIKQRLASLENKNDFFFGNEQQDCPEIVTWARQKKINFHTIMVVQKIYKILDRCVHVDPIHENTLGYFRSASQLFIIKNKARLVTITQRELGFG